MGGARVLVHPRCYDMDRETFLALLDRSGGWYAAVRFSQHLGEQRCVLPWHVADWMSEHEARVGGWDAKA